MSIDAMKQALEALDGLSEPYDVLRAQEALRAAIEQAQEPVAVVEYMNTGGNVGIATRIVEIYDPMRERLRAGDKLYTTPRQWQGLTEAEKVNVAYRCGCADVAWLDFADAIEAKLRQKNA